jgi:flavin-dependent dehydrogenase
MYDIAVIGAGPAGTSAAITAARMGAKVALLDKGTFPRNKVCGEFVSAESLHLLSSLLPARPDLLDHTLRIGRTQVFIDDRILKTAIEPPGASIARFDLDAALWDSAKDTGVDLFEGEPVQRVLNERTFVVTTANRQFSARSVVDASGRWSNLNRPQSDSLDGGAKWLGLKAHFAQTAESDSVDLYFFPGGYCGVQPVASHQGFVVNACAMIRADVGTSLAEAFNCHPRLWERSRGWRQLTQTVATAPLRFHPPEPFREGILRVGDAAAFVDPFVGDGISLALRSGRLAAQSLCVCLNLDDFSLQQAGEMYAESYRRDLASVYHASSQIRRLLGLPPFVRRGILLALSRFPALTHFMIRKTR